MTNAGKNFGIAIVWYAALVGLAGPVLAVDEKSPARANGKLIVAVQKLFLQIILAFSKDKP